VARFFGNLYEAVVDMPQLCRTPTKAAVRADGSGKSFALLRADSSIDPRGDDHCLDRRLAVRS
jgi:hypothetical protein